MSVEPAKSLHGKNILIGISGGIAAYKMPECIRRLKDFGANVRVVMTKGAQAFVTPLTLQAVSTNPVHHDLLDPAAEAAMGHIELAKWADLILVAPASANTIARLAHGFADDLLSTVCLATNAPIAIAPAMNQQMWAAPAVQANIAVVKGYGIHVIEPAAGEQACGDVGAGRMPEPLELRAMVVELVQPQKPLLAGQHVVITAGPTREAIDPVRYLSNHSSGKMGFALATAAQQAGAQVTLVAGPCTLPTPAGVHRIDVTSAEDMLQAVQGTLASCDIFMSCAAVADYRPVAVASQKMKKNASAMQLELTRTTDILATVAAHAPAPFTLGFAAETHDVEAYAAGKLTNKKLNMIAANDVSDQRIGFNSDQNAMTLLWQDDHGELQQQGLATAAKADIARAIIKQVATVKNATVNAKK